MYSCGEGVQFLRMARRLNGFFESSYMPQEQSVPAVAPGVARVQFYCTLELSFRFFPLPLVFLASRGEGSVRFSNCPVEGNCLRGKFYRFRIDKFRQVRTTSA